MNILKVIGLKQYCPNCQSAMEVGLDFNFNQCIVCSGTGLVWIHVWPFSWLSDRQVKRNLDKKYGVGIWRRKPNDA